MNLSACCVHLISDDTELLITYLYVADLQQNFPKVPTNIQYFNNNTSLARTPPVVIWILSGKCHYAFTFNRKYLINFRATEKQFSFFLSSLYYFHGLLLYNVFLYASKRKNYGSRKINKQSQFQCSTTSIKIKCAKKCVAFSFFVIFIRNCWNSRDILFSFIFWWGNNGWNLRKYTKFSSYYFRYRMLNFWCPADFSFVYTCG